MSPTKNIDYLISIFIIVDAHTFESLLATFLPLVCFFILFWVSAV